MIYMFFSVNLGAKGGGYIYHVIIQIWYFYYIIPVWWHIILYLYLYKLPLFGGWNMLQKAHPFFYQKIQLGEPTKDGPNDRNLRWISSTPPQFHSKSPWKPWWLEAVRRLSFWVPFVLVQGRFLLIFQGVVGPEKPGVLWVVTFLLWPKKAF